MNDGLHWVSSGKSDFTNIWTCSGVHAKIVCIPFQGKKNTWPGLCLQFAAWPNSIALTLTDIFFKNLFVNIIIVYSIIPRRIFATKFGARKTADKQDFQFKYMGKQNHLLLWFYHTINFKCTHFSDVLWHLVMRNPTAHHRQHHLPVNYSNQEADSSIYLVWVPGLVCLGQKWEKTEHIITTTTNSSQFATYPIFLY